MYLAANLLIETLEDNDVVRTERVLHVDRPRDIAVLFDVGRDRALPAWHGLSAVQIDLEEGRRRVLRHDPWLAKPRADDRLTDAERSGRDLAWSIIEPMVAAGPEKVLDREARGALIAQLVDSRTVSKPTVYRYLYRYWRGGQSIHALIPRYERCGGPGDIRTGSAHGGKKRGRPSLIEELTGQVTGINVDESLRLRLVRMGKEFYENRGYTQKQSYLEGLKKYFHDGYDVLRDGTQVPILPPPEKLPSFGQYMYWYRRASDPDEALRRRKGQRTYELKHRALHGDSTEMTFGPGSSYEIDSTTGDVYLVSSRDSRLVIGRPIIYVVVDTFSRLVVGFTVGLEGPSWMGALLAFESVATDKVEFCRSMGIDILPEDWPVEHLPEAILADRGELKGPKADLFAQALGVRVANTPPYRPDWKPVVEKRFDLINQRIVHWLPGAVTETERGDRDYRLDATMTLAELREVLTFCFLEHNKTTLIEDYPMSEDMRRDGVRPYPLELWRWGLEHRNGGLRYVPPEVVRQRLLPRARATMTERGLRFRRRYYTCDLIAAKNWCAKARQSGTWGVDIAYDPWSSGSIWMDLAGYSDLMVCNEIPGAGAAGDVPWAELKLEEALDKLSRNREEGWRRQTQTLYDAQIDRVVEEAKNRIASMPEVASRAELLRNITVNRQQERLIEQKDGRKIIEDGESGVTQQPAEISSRDEEVSALDSLVAAKGEDLLDDAGEDRVGK